MSSNTFWDIRAKGREAEVDLFGVIGGEPLFEESVVASDFIRNLRDIGRMDRIYVNIHSPGGNIFDGFAIYDALRSNQAEIYVRVPSIAASMATIIVLAGDVIEVTPETAFMVHRPEGWAAGNEDVFEDALTSLKRAKEKLIGVYSRRTGQDRDLIDEKLAGAGTWFVGEEIIEFGFATVMKEDQPAMRVAASLDLTETSVWRDAPGHVKKLLARKPVELPPETAARVEKLKAYAS